MRPLRASLLFSALVLTGSAFAQASQSIDDFSTGLGELRTNDGTVVDRYDTGGDMLGATRWTVLERGFETGANNHPLIATTAPLDLTVTASVDVSTSLYLAYGMTAAGPNDFSPGTLFDFSNWDAIGLHFNHVEGDIQVGFTLFQEVGSMTQTTYDTYLLPGGTNYDWYFSKSEFQSHNPAFDLTNIQGMGVQIFTGSGVSYSLGELSLVRSVPEPSSVAALALGASFVFRPKRRTSQK